jgi:hypothetical protein
VAGKASRKGLANAHQSRTWHAVNRAAVTALNRRPRDRFFLYLHYVDVHDYVFQKTTYAEAVKRMDEGVGRLIAQLESFRASTRARLATTGIPPSRSSCGFR